MSTRKTRRQFLQTAGMTGAALLGAPRWVSPAVLGLGRLAEPSERIRVGLIGCGNHGAGWNLDQIFRCPDVQVVGLCDVDRRHLEAAQKKVDRHYAPLIGKEYRPCPGTGDFRQLIQRKDVDAVAVCTPDHWHVLPALMAVKCGKDVICEKPLTLFVEEGKVLSKAVRAHARVFQTASENRSIDVHIRLIELVRGGAIGPLKHIDVGLPKGNTVSRIGKDDRAAAEFTSPQPVPEWLNYDLWLGQAPLMPYIPARLHGAFRWNLAFSGGVLTDWGAHMIDMAQWGHDSEMSGPVSVEGRADFPPRDAVHNTPATCELHYVYADGVTMRVHTNGPSLRFEGRDGWLEGGFRKALTASRPELLTLKVDPERVKLYRPSEIVAFADGGKGGEHRNFYDCVKSRKDCYAPAEIGHRTITIAHIGNIAMQLRRKLRWDPAREDFVGDAEASALLSRPQRDPWTLAQVDKWL